MSSRPPDVFLPDQKGEVYLGHVLQELPTLPPSIAKPKRLPSNKKKNRNLIKVSVVLINFFTEVNLKEILIVIFKLYIIDCTPQISHFEC